jgi:putative phosphoribosyl transferase
MLANRTEAGQQLAQKLIAYCHHPDALVVALPRGGVPVAFEIARTLYLPLTVHLVRKLGVPHHPELAMGAIAWQGAPVINRDIYTQFGVTKAVFEQVLAREREELERRHQMYCGDCPPRSYRDRTLIVVDDGIATGATLQAALQTLTLQRPQAIVVAVPVLAASFAEKLRSQVRQVVALLEPESLTCISQWYRDFHQLTDGEVAAYMQRASDLTATPAK